MISIFAGNVSHVQFKPGVDGEVDDAGKVTVEPVKDEFVPAGTPLAVGPVFAIKSLDYFAYQDLFLGDASQADKVRKAFEVALVDIDNDKDKLKLFRESPSARIAPALFNAIYEASAGN